MVGWMWVKLWKWDRLAVSSGCVKGVEGLFFYLLCVFFSTVHPVRSINCLKHLAANCLESMILTKGSPHIFCGCTVKCPNVCRDLLRWWNLTQYASYFDGRLWTRWFKIYQILPHFTFSDVFCAARTRDFKLGNKQLWTWHVVTPMTPFPPCFQQLPVQFNLFTSRSDPFITWSNSSLRILAVSSAPPWNWALAVRNRVRFSNVPRAVGAMYGACCCKEQMSPSHCGWGGGQKSTQTFPKFNGWNPFEISWCFPRNRHLLCLKRLRSIFRDIPGVTKARSASLECSWSFWGRRLGGLRCHDEYIRLGWMTYTFSLLNFPSKWAICWWGLAPTSRTFFGKLLLLLFHHKGGSS